MRKRYWAGAGLAVVAAIAALGNVRSGPPASIWTDGVRICDAPGGSPVEGVSSGPGRSPRHNAHGEAARRNAIADEWMVTDPRHRCVFRAFEASRMECLAESVRNRTWIDGFSVIRSYAPAEGVADVIDADGVTWWRCDLDAR